MARYLIVDDSRTSRMVLAATLRAAAPQGSSIDEAETLDEALASAQRAPPDVVFLDMMLDLQRTGAPGGSTGLVALQLLLEEHPQAVVVLVTALPADDPDVESALAMGASAALEKPVSAERARELLAGIHASAAREREA
jgi:CheY-like chemotaxis protein